ncbi:hypothetical protein V5735_16620 (plasmid) [Haladaptatus sp. SPP-AMP-3]
MVTRLIVLLVSVLENPVVHPCNPLCHFVEIGATVRRSIELMA